MKAFHLNLWKTLCQELYMALLTKLVVHVGKVCLSFEPVFEPINVAIHFSILIFIPEHVSNFLFILIVLIAFYVIHLT